jgi:putative membrane protein insertion efficiency factor
MKKLVIGFIRIYQVTLSPFVGQHCRFTPTCSQYMIDAINIKGLLRGICLGLWRIMRCNPFNRGGYDPVEQGRSE